MNQVTSSLTISFVLFSKNGEDKNNLIGTI